MHKQEQDPRIVTFDSLKFLGLKTRIRADLFSPNDLTKVPTLWQQLRSQISDLPQRIGQETYALITGDLPEGRFPEAYYYALIAVQNFDKVPPSLESLELPKGRMAKFRHRGPPQVIGVTAMRALREWLPESAESIAVNQELMIYPAGYDRNKPDGEFDFCIFLK